jgi:hypothetical protein
MFRFRKASLAIVLLLAVLSLHPVLAGRVSATAGIGMYPVEIDISNALRGAEYVRPVNIINGREGDLKLDFTQVGGLIGWMRIFDPDDLENEIQETIVPPKTEHRYLLYITIPEDAPNGPHRGGIQFQGEASAPEGDTSGMGTSVGIGLSLTINVTGDQHISGNVMDAWVNHIEVDRPPARLHVRYLNDGNIQSTPVLNWKIRNSADEIVGEVSYNDRMVHMEELAIIKSEWDSSGQPIGEYFVDLEVVLDNQVIDQRELSFQILPYGSLRRGGQLDWIRLVGEPAPGNMVMLVGVFRNTGQIDVNSVFSAEVHFQGNLIDFVESRDRVVPMGEEAALEAPLSIPEAGDYLVKGKVNYEGWETETIELAFSVEDVDGHQMVSLTAPSQEIRESREQPGPPYLLWALAGLLGIVVASGVTFMLGRRLSSAEARRADVYRKASSSENWD